MDPTLIPSDGSAAERPEETGGGLALDPEAAPSAVRLDALLTADPKFRRSWGQDRKDQSPTAYNLSLATMAMQAGWSDQEVVNLLICWRRKHGHDLKLGEGYYEIILSKAKEPIVMAQAQEQLDEALLLRPEDQSEVLKANLTTLFRVDIIRIVKYLGEPPVYYMYTKQGDITLGEINKITSQISFRNMVATITGVWISAVSKKAWDQRIQAILLVCEPIDVRRRQPPGPGDQRLAGGVPAEETTPGGGCMAEGRGGRATLHPPRKGPHHPGRLPKVAGAQHRRAGHRPRPGAEAQAVPGPDGEGQREAGKLPDLSHHLATAREIPCQTGPGRASALSPSS